MHFEPSNSELLDEDFSYAADPLTAGLEAGGKVFEGIGKVATAASKSQLGKDIKAVCGKKKHGKKKSEYNKCVNDFHAQQQELERLKISSPLEAAKIQQETSKMQREAEYIRSQQENTPKKLLGMPMGVGIAVISVVSITLLFVAYKLIKK
jgi:hypothetical protein